MTARRAATYGRFRSGAVRCGFALLACCTLASISGQLGRRWSFTDIGNYLMPLWLGLGLAGAATVILCARRGQLPALAFLLPLLLACAADRMVPEWHARLEMAAAAPPRDIRLIQFNLLKENVDPLGTAAWIRSQHADVVVIEEAALAAAVIPQRLAHDLPYQAGCFAHRPCSTLILSRRPFRAVFPLGRGDPENHRGRSMLAVALDGPGGPFVVIGLHLDHPWPRDRQEADLVMLNTVLATLPRASTIVAGDFNAASWSFAMDRQDRLIELPRLTRALPTWPVRLGGWRTYAPMLPFDHVYAGDAWRVVALSAGPTLGSDHRPVLVDLRWRGRRTVAARPTGVR